MDKQIYVIIQKYIDTKEGKVIHKIYDDKSYALKECQKINSKGKGFYEVRQYKLFEGE